MLRRNAAARKTPLVSPLGCVRLLWRGRIPSLDQLGVTVTEVCGSDVADAEGGGGNASDAAPSSSSDQAAPREKKERSMSELWGGLVQMDDDEVMSCNVMSYNGMSCNVM